ncbi:MAG: hypothetical protein AAGE98_04525 [Actinomycetota bacterium]
MNDLETRSTLTPPVWLFAGVLAVLAGAGVYNIVAGDLTVGIASLVIAGALSPIVRQVWRDR